MKKLITAGVDEVGRGCLAGPVVSAAVILKKGINLKLLKDSKKISFNLLKWIIIPSKPRSLMIILDPAPKGYIGRSNWLSFKKEIKFSSDEGWN